jgi:hypothetical protein
MTAILKVDTIQDTSGNNIINESSDTITIGASGDTIALAGTTVTGITQGITEADMWRLTTDITSNVDPIASNLERIDDASFAKIGTGMSVSSGIWSFPVTGLYEVIATGSLATNGDDNVSINIYATLNNSSYDILGYVWGGTDGGGAAGTNTGSMRAYVNVTDVSNVKVKFVANSIGAGSSILGNTDGTYTGFNFIRLGDSQ